MRRFMPVSRIEKESVWPVAEDGWHCIAEENGILIAPFARLQQKMVAVEIRQEEQHYIFAQKY